MRRRGPGIGGIKRHEDMKSSLREKGAELREDRVKHAEEVIREWHPLQDATLALYICHLGTLDLPRTT